MRFLTVPVLVVFVMDVSVIMLQELMFVPVLVLFGQMEPNADSHKTCSD